MPMPTPPQVPGSEPTSDIGMMYRNYLQSKGQALTPENMSRVISQSQREPGMIAGLNVQAPGPNPSTPPNVASASPSSSGGPLPLPPAQVPPPTPLQAAPNQLPHAPFPAPTSQPASMPGTGGSPISSAQAGETSPTPPPGQSPAPDQSIGGGISAHDIYQDALPLLGVGGAGMLAAYLGRNRAVEPPSVSTPTPPGPGPRVESLPTVGPQVAPNAKSVASAVNSGSAPPSVASSHPSVMPQSQANTHPEVMPRQPGTHDNVMPGDGSKSAPHMPGEPMHPSVMPGVGESSKSIGSIIERSIASPTEDSLDAYIKQTPQARTTPEELARMKDVAGPGRNPDTLFPNSSTRQGMHDPSLPAAPVPQLRGGPRVSDNGISIPSPTATSPIGNIFFEKEPVQGPPVGPRPEQGPPVGPKPQQGPPELTTVREAPREIVPQLPYMGSKLNMRGLKSMRSVRIP